MILFYAALFALAIMLQNQPVPFAILISLSVGYHLAVGIASGFDDREG